MSQEELMFLGMILELIIIIVAIILLTLIYKKYLEKRHRYTLILFFAFTCFLITIFFTWLSKIVQLYAQPETAIPGTIEGYFILRIINYRFAFASFAMGSALIYVLRVNVFEDGYKKLEEVFVFSFGIIIILIDFFFPISPDKTSEFIAFLLLLIYVTLIYLPFIRLCIIHYKGVEDPVYKKGFFSLTIMSIATSLILVFQFIDVLYLVIEGYEYTLFYFMSLVSIVLAYFGAYFGFVKPKK